MTSDGSTGTKIALKSRDSGTRSWKLWSPAIIRKFRRFVTRKTASTSSTNAGALGIDVRLGPLEQQPADERERRERRQVRDQPRQRVARAQVIDEHGGDADRGRRRRPEQRHRQHEREERAGDPLAVVADRKPVGDQRERSRIRTSPGGCQSSADGGEYAPPPRRRQQHGLADDQHCRSRRHLASIVA